MSTLASPDVSTIRKWLTERVAVYLEMCAADVPPRAPLAELGLDSVYAISLCGDIEQALGVPVEPTLAWDYPTIEDIAAHLTQSISDREGRSGD